ADGADGVPHVGDIYGLKVVVKVVGNPSQPFRIKWTLANVTYYYDSIDVGPGDGWFWEFLWWLDLDDPIPWSVTLDPDGVSGDTNLVNNTARGTFTPVPPSVPIDLYSNRMMHGFETYTLSFEPGSGVIPNLYVVFGEPTTHGAQTAISDSPPPASQSINTPPYGVPIYEIARTNVAAGTFQDTNSFVVQLNRIRVNPGILRTATWAQMAALGTNWTQWLAPDQRVESTNPLVTAFVQQSLPSNYQATLTPYDTARTLHRAVMRRLVYQSPPDHIDAVGVLQDGFADCGGFAALMAASLRNVGIPARCISGFRQDETVWHVRVEFHLPGVDWIVADPTDGNAADPTGTYAFDFGYVPNADSFVAVDVGDSHIRPYYDFPFIQTPNWVWNGGATFDSYTASAYLQPNGVLSVGNSPPGSVALTLNDPPTAGIVVLQSSSNLVSWSSIATNSADGSVINYFFPTGAAPRQFFRASVSP